MEVLCIRISQLLYAFITDNTPAESSSFTNVVSPSNFIQLFPRGELLDFWNWGANVLIARLRNHNLTDDDNVDFRSL